MGRLTNENIERIAEELVKKLTTPNSNRIVDPDIEILKEDAEHLENYLNSHFSGKYQLLKPVLGDSDKFYIQARRLG